MGKGGLLPLALDAEEVFTAAALGLGDHAVVVAAGLKLGEEGADLGDELFGGAEVEGSLAAVLAVGEAVVGAAAAAVLRADPKTAAAPTVFRPWETFLVVLG